MFTIMAMFTAPVNNEARKDDESKRAFVFLVAGPGLEPGTLGL